MTQHIISQRHIRADGTDPEHQGMAEWLAELGYPEGSAYWIETTVLVEDVNGRAGHVVTRRTPTMTNCPPPKDENDE